MISTKALLIIAIPLALVGCIASSPEYNASDESTVVLPTKNAWEKPGSTRDDVKTAQSECREELKMDSGYVDAVKDAGSAAVAKDRRSMISSMKVSSSYFETCMLKKGFRYVPL